MLLLALTLGGCSAPRRTPGVAASWLAGHPMPAFDPDGPPDALRVALERQLSRGLVERDAGGRVRPALADSIGVSRDSLTWTFRLRAGMRFTDGSVVTSGHIRDALAGGLARGDHATREWLLAAIQGVSKVRVGRPVPALGIETPDGRRLVLRLASPDRRLLEKLAVPGVSTPWRRRSGTWRDAVGVGPYRVAAGEGERSLTLVRASPVAGVRAAADTLRIRFLGGAIRVRNILRRSGADVLWPVPPGFLEPGLPSGWELLRASAGPDRRLLLVLRADVPPLTQAAAREALARAIRREQLLAALDGLGEPLPRWLPGANEPYEWPRLEWAAERVDRLAGEAAERADVAPAAPRRVERTPTLLGSYHVTLAFDADLSGAIVAPVLQGQWAAAGHYADLRALHGSEALAQPLKAAAPQAALVESQALLPGLEAELAFLVAPIRGPARGGFRTGWRTREYDPWLLPPGPRTELNADALQRAIAADRIVLPIASLPWVVGVRAGAPRPDVHPAFGPDWTVPDAAAGSARTR